VRAPAPPVTTAPAVVRTTTTAARATAADTVHTRRTTVADTTTEDIATTAPISLLLTLAAIHRHFDSNTFCVKVTSQHTKDVIIIIIIIIIAVTGDPIETIHLFQRLSVVQIRVRATSKRNC